MKTLLIISGGIEAVPAMKIARHMGLRVIVSDGNEHAPAFNDADEKLIVSTYDPKGTADAAYEMNKRIPIDGVITVAADVPHTVAAVAHRLNLPGPSLETAGIAMDKLAMKEKFIKYGIPVPWFCQVKSQEHLKEILKEKKDKYLVIKPVDSRGARGVIRLLPEVDIEWAYKESLGHSPTGRVMVEEWIKGKQISSESIITEDGLVTPGLSDRNYQYLDRFAPYVIEDGGDLPPEITEEQKKDIDDLLAGVANCLSVKMGTLKGDIVIGNNGPVIIEVALRLSGGYFCTHTIPLTTGSNIVEAAILIALGEKIDLKDYAPLIKQHVCQRFLFPSPGIVKKVEVNKDIINNKNLAMMKIYVKEGDIVQKTTSHPCRAGMIITTGKSRVETRELAGKILDNIIITTEPVRIR